MFCVFFYLLPLSTSQFMADHDVILIVQETIYYPREMMFFQFKQKI